jgi:hypothetical protein
MNKAVGHSRHPSTSILASPIDDLVLTSNSLTIAEATVRTFEPQMDVQTTGGLLAVFLITTIAGSFWWNIIVPQKRTELSLSKGKGEIKEYLDELREAEGEDSRGLERWLFTDWLRKTPGSMKPGITAHPLDDSVEFMFFFLTHKSLYIFAKPSHKSLKLVV